MNEVITIGVDLAKNVFQVHGVDAEGEVVIRRQLRRSRVMPFLEKQRRCLVGMEARASIATLEALYDIGTADDLAQWRASRGGPV